MANAKLEREMRDWLGAKGYKRFRGEQIDQLATQLCAAFELATDLADGIAAGRAAAGGGSSTTAALGLVLAARTLCVELDREFETDDSWEKILKIAEIAEAFYRERMQ